MADETPNPASDKIPPKIRLNIASSGSPPPPHSRQPDAKKETTRIDLSQAIPPAAEKVGGAPSSRTQDEPSPEIAKRGTIRIDAPQAAKADTQKVKTETQKISPRPMSETMRVEVAEPRKTETTRINIPPEVFEKKPGATPREKPPEGAEDIFKRSTIPVGIPTPPPAPAARPKTLSVKRAAPQSAESTPAVAPPDEQTVAEAKKSETARIDLPATTSERPATRPKTIRIKRPEAAAVKKPLTITRPSVESAATDVGATSEEESVGTIFSALAVAALLVVCVLIYVLAAQTFAPDLPFPGRV